VEDEDDKEEEEEEQQLPDKVLCLAFLLALAK
jgi:hypothetical protein